MGGGSINPFREMFSLLIDESIDCGKSFLSCGFYCSTD
jgi:hypothetical protein